MKDAKGNTVTVGARCVFGDDRTVGTVRTVKKTNAIMRKCIRGDFMARCDDGTHDNADLRTNGHTASEWVGSAHIEVIS